MSIVTETLRPILERFQQGQEEGWSWPETWTVGPEDVENLLNVVFLLCDPGDEWYPDDLERQRIRREIGAAIALSTRFRAP